MVNNSSSVDPYSRINSDQPPTRLNRIQSKIGKLAGKINRAMQSVTYFPSALRKTMRSEFPADVISVRRPGSSQGKPTPVNVEEMVQSVRKETQNRSSEEELTRTPEDELASPDGEASNVLAVYIQSKAENMSDRSTQKFSSE
jgi:hypothetical protein